MSGFQKWWRAISTIGFIVSTALVLTPKSVRADSPSVSSKLVDSANAAMPQPISSSSQKADIATAEPILSTTSVTQVKVVGSTILSAAELSKITTGVTHHGINLIALNQIADEITQLYLKRGFATSRAIVPLQSIKSNGVVTIQVIEGWLGEIQVKGNHQLQSGYIQSRLRLAGGTPLNIHRLEAQIRLLNTDPMLEHVEASLRAGTKPGESILIADVQETARSNSSLSSDNYSSVNGFPQQTRVSASYRNPIGVGDELTLASSLGPPQSYIDGINGSENYDVSYRIPVNAREGAVQLRASVDDRLIGDTAYAALGLRSRDEVYSLTFRQPLVRSLRQEFALSAGFSADRSQTFLFKNIPYPFVSSADAQGVTQTRILQFGQDYTLRDPLGTWSIGSVFNVGLGILGATEQSSSTPDGQFFSWQLQGQRVQQLGRDNLLIAQGNLQLSPDGLLSSQQFNLGGAQSVRGFRRNVRSGDNGWRLTLEGRVPILKTSRHQPIVQLAPFVEAGAVWNCAGNPSGPVAQGFLAGVGLGLLWQPNDSLNVRIDYGIPLVNLPDQTNGFQDSGIYFSVTSKQ